VSRRFRVGQRWRSACFFGNVRCMASCHEQSRGQRIRALGAWQCAVSFAHCQRGAVERATRRTGAPAGFGDVFGGAAAAMLSTIRKRHAHLTIESVRVTMPLHSRRDDPFAITSPPRAVDEGARVMPTAFEKRLSCKSGAAYGCSERGLLHGEQRPVRPGVRGSARRRCGGDRDCGGGDGATGIECGVSRGTGAAERIERPWDSRSHACGVAA
jgi:hypothetical protein